MINLLGALMKKVEKRQQQVNNISREIEILTMSQKKMLKLKTQLQKLKTL